MKWRYETSDWVNASAGIGSNGAIYVGSEDHYLYALNPDGTLKWKYQTGGGIYSIPAVGSDGTIYIGSGDYYVYAIEGSAGKPPSAYFVNFPRNTLTKLF